jgi:hypothetical protein
MSARVCRSCDYNVVSTVVTACPNCGERLPTSLASASSSSVSMMGLALILIAGGAAWVVMREPSAAPSAPAPVPPSTTSAPAATRPLAATPVKTARGRDDAQVAKLVALLDDPQEGYQAAAALAKMDSPRAQKALMAAYDRREYGKMVGAAGFYARTRPPGYEKVLVALLSESRDLAVAQDLILSRDPKLAGPATKWAAEQGFKLVKSSQTPTGVTWTSVTEPSR